MTVAEIEKQIKKEKKYIERLKAKIADIKSDISATKKAIDMWDGMLKSAKVVEDYYCDRKAR